MPVQGRSVPHAHIKLLVEIAIKDSAIPSHINSISTHDAICCLRVEAVQKQLRFEEYWSGDTASSQRHVPTQEPFILTFILSQLCSLISLVHCAFVKADLTEAAGLQLHGWKNCFATIIIWRTLPARGWSLRASRYDSMTIFSSCYCLQAYLHVGLKLFPLDEVVCISLDGHVI